MGMCVLNAILPCITTFEWELRGRGCADFLHGGDASVGAHWRWAGGEKIC